MKCQALVQVNRENCHNMMSAPFAYSILKVNEQNLSVQVENVYDKSTWERQVNMFH